MAAKLQRVAPEVLLARVHQPVDPETLATASAIVEDVRTGGIDALRSHAERLGDAAVGAPLLADRAELEAALRGLAPDDRALLERTATRIRAFAKAQRACLVPLDVEVPGGRAGHRWLPAASAGAYAPGGRYPLPSSVLMTVIPAKVAGVAEVWVASPRPAPVTLAAAALAGADGLLKVGGAQAIAALALGTLTPAADVIVGPGNRFVTAAKKHLVGEVGIDGLAGPSELLVVADAHADPGIVAADLLAQAEHDVDAAPLLVTTCSQLADAVDAELERQLASLPTAEVARLAVARNGRATIVNDLEAAARVADALAPEHLELLVADPHELAALAERVRNYGGLFIGPQSAEVFGDYGVGPNHTLPTGGSARYQAGLSVATFLRASTFLELDDPTSIAADAARLARLEGLEAHARAAERAAPEGSRMIGG